MDKLSNITLTEEQYDQVQKMAAANYSAKDIAIFFNLDIKLFKDLLEDKTSRLYEYYYRGQLMVRAQIDITLANFAAQGGITAIQTQMKRKSELDFETIKHEIFDL